MRLTNRRDLPKSLERRIIEVKDYEGCYEREHDWEKVLKKLEGTNPFSIIVFYESDRKAKTPVEKVIVGGSTRRYGQFYFIPELEQRREGATMGSGYRNTQSVYACALSQMSQQVPTHILIYGKKLYHVLSSRSLIVQPHEVVGGYVSVEEADEILKDTRKAVAHRGIRNMHKVTSIYLF